MAKNRTVRVTSESDSGRNQRFTDNQTGRNMSREEFVKAIDHGTYDNYHVRNINGVSTPCSNPDGNSSNNLG